MVADMAADCVIGVDLGGTKVLAGAVDSDQQVHHRAQRTVLGLEQSPLLDTIVDSVEEVRAAAPNAPEAVGFGIPSLIDRPQATLTKLLNGFSRVSTARPAPSGELHRVDSSVSDL